jgi:hypothetical protein
MSHDCHSASCPYPAASVFRKKKKEQYVPAACMDQCNKIERWRRKSNLGVSESLNHYGRVKVVLIFLDTYITSIIYLTILIYFKL